MAPLKSTSRRLSSAHPALPPLPLTGFSCTELCGKRQCFSNFIAHTKLISANLGKMQVGIQQVGGVGSYISDKLSGDVMLRPIGHTLGTRKVEEE